jgi:hypothetical protein|tara:strand:+ start:309 stop:590 length:282 start_codon:yes stop_codon:yes gene_type:complete
MEWMQISVIILVGAIADDPPSTSMAYSKIFDTMKVCEDDLFENRLTGDRIAKRVRTSGVFLDGDYQQLVVSGPVDLLEFGEGFIHFSCVPTLG